jgi:hypothetical protein
MVKNFTPINERLCVIRIKGFFNYSLINIHAPTNDSEVEAKDFMNSWSGHTQPAQVMT